MSLIAASGPNDMGLAASGAVRLVMLCGLTVPQMQNLGVFAPLEQKQGNLFASQQRLTLPPRPAMALISAQSPVAAEQDGPTIIFHLEDLEHMSPEVRTGAQIEVVRIYAAAGVRVVWVEGVAGVLGIDDRPLHVVVVVVDAAGTDRMAARDGFGPGVGGSAARVANRTYIFFPRVAYMARLRGRDIGRTIGVAIAHEVGHLLLPMQGHSLIGIMRADLDLESMWPQEFTSSQSEAIKAKLRAPPKRP